MLSALSHEVRLSFLLKSGGYQAHVITDNSVKIVKCERYEDPSDPSTIESDSNIYSVDYEWVFCDCIVTKGCHILELASTTNKRKPVLLKVYTGSVGQYSQYEISNQRNKILVSRWQ